MNSNFRMFNLCPETNSMIITSTWGELNIALNARRIELGTSAQTWYFYMLGPKWSVECSNLIHNFQDSTCKLFAVEPTGTLAGMYNVTFTFLWDRNPEPCFLPKNSQHHGDLLPENGFEAANTFFCRNHKSHLTSLCCRVSWDTVTFVREKRKKTITNLNLTLRPRHDPTTQKGEAIVISM